MLGTSCTVEPQRL
ncbi:hypothetical protein LINPERHAP1_LOCUS315 [Linum perenne]